MSEQPELPTFPMERGKCPFDPPPQYGELRETEPVSQATLRNGSTAWLVTSHEHVRQILADPRVSSDRQLPGCPRLIPVPPAMMNPSMRPLVAMDPPEHTEHRRMVTAEFTVKRIQGMRPRIQEIVDEHIDKMLAGGGTADLVAALARPVPSLVICELLGVPYELHHDFHRISEVIVHGDSTPPMIGAAIMELRKFLGELIAVKEQDPGEDLLSRLVVRYQETGEYDRERVISTAQILLNAGHETTTSMIGLGTLALLEHPEQLAALQNDPSLIPGAVDELLRYLSIADMATFRTATEDIEIGGKVIPAGEGLIALGAAANRDSSVFPDADTLDVHRNPRQHVAFGYGIHQCLGQNLGRLELEIVFTTLLSKIPGLKLAAPVESLKFRSDGLLYGIYSLPVSW
ncbi:cytochrome P450 [Lentzea sp. NPDC005914]|uniref:cytochrome P450 n=1 Tax=Lentzea sp. NPDC005914 TaxID=3154572 RepID=UPI0033C45F2F